MTELLIIADDLTGAIEAGVQLSKCGITASIAIDPDTDLKPILVNENITVLVVNTESRHLLPKEAATRIRGVFQSVGGKGIKWFYKKTDSTMRGNIGSELEAFLKEIHQSVLPYIPAHPKLKRFTRDGYQYIGDTLLHQTSFANDPHEPRKESFVPGILKKQTDIEICLSEPNESESEISGSLKRRILVFNCRSESDLKNIGENILKNKWQKAIAGTAGFVEILPDLLSLRTSKINFGNIGGPILFVNGSINVVSLRQVDYAKAKGVVTILFSPQILSAEDFKISSDFLQIKEKIKTEFQFGRNVIISTTDSRYLGNSVPLKNMNSKLFSKKIGQIIAALLQVIHVNTLCVFGGDTLMSIMRETGAGVIEAKTEILPGVAYTKTSLHSGEICLLSKPGGYGEENGIVEIINRVKLKK